MIIPLNEIASKLLMVALFVEKRDTDKDIAYMFNDFFDISFVAKILQKRIEVLNLPPIEPTAIMALSAIGNNPVRGILALIETYEKADELKPEKINAAFICEHVYPMGFYDDEELSSRFDYRREKREGKYDFII
jgi:hypothetical protein